jgi:hypothetical protein
MQHISAHVISPILVRIVCARDLYDPRNTILASVFDDSPSSFPQGLFASPSWLNVLEDLGLRKKVKPYLQIALKYFGAMHVH